MQVLPPAPLGPNPYATALGASFDARFVVGETIATGLIPAAVMWRDGVPEALGPTNGWTGSRATGVSDDGTIAVGLLYTPTTSAPGVWTAGSGWRTLPDYLASQGLPLPSGWTLGGETFRCRPMGGPSRATFSSLGNSPKRS